jgi:hypothetical protein
VKVLHTSGFAVFDVSDKKTKDRDYFNRLFHETENGGREAMLYYLLNMDISGVDLRTVPRTKGLVKQIVYSMKDVEKFWFGRLCEGTILPGDPGWRDGEQIELDNLSLTFKHYQDQIKSKTGIDNSQLSKQLRNLCPGIRDRRPVKNGQKITCIVFPSLDVCRRAFERQIQQEIDWDD